MVDLSALNPFRQGQSALQDARQQFDKSAADPRQDASAQSNANRGRSLDSVALSDDAVAAQNDAKKLAPASDRDLSEDRLTPGDTIDRALAASLEMVRSSVEEMFQLSGMSAEDATSATDAMFKGIREAAAGDDQFEFSFDQAIKSFSRTAISYSGSDGSAVGVSESTMMAVQSLDISIDRNSGEFSFNYQANQLHFLRAEGIAVGKTAAGAQSALGKLLDGLGTGSLVDMMGNPANADNGGLLFDMSDNGVADFIREMMNATVGTDGAGQDGEQNDGAAEQNASSASLAAERMAALNAQITEKFMEQATLIVRGIDQSASDDGTGKPKLNLTIDMLMPLGRFGQDENGPTLSSPNGDLLHIAPSQPSKDQFA